MSLSTDLQAAISQLQTDHSSLVTAVRARNGVSGATNTAIANKMAGDATIQTKVDSLRAAVAAATTESLSLDFINEIYQWGSGKLSQGLAFSDAINFTRSSTATRFSRDGKMEVLAENTPRFDYDPVTRLIKGLLIEESRTNLNAHSAQISNLSYAGSAIINPNAAVAPDGTLTASMVENTPSAGSYFSKALGALVDGGTYTRSIYVKSNGVNPFTIIFEGVGVGTYTSFDVVAKTFSGATGVSRGYTDVGNGWLRVYVTGVHTAGATTIGGAFYIGGYPTNSAQHRGYIWGIQAELGAFATSYVPTPASFAGRSSTALYLDSNGVFKTAASGVARSNAYGYDSTGALRSIGLLIEKPATRLNTSGSSFASTGKQEMTVSLTGATVKGLPETKLIPTSATDSHRITVHTHTVDSVASRNSVIAKAGEYRYLILTRKNSYVEVNDQYARFDLQTGTIQADYTGSARITPLGDGLYRCEMTATNTNSTTNSFSVAVESSISSVGYNKTAGDGTSGLYLYHAQCEDGTVATSPMIGEGSQITRAGDASTSPQVTRAADMAAVKSLITWFRADEGSLFAEASQPALPNTSKSTVSLSNGSTANRYTLYRAHITNSINGYANPGSLALISNIPAVAGEVWKQSISYKGTQLSYAVNGVALANPPTSSTNTSLITSLVLGNSNPGGSEYLNGHLRNVRFYPKKLSNAELQALTV